MKQHNRIHTISEVAREMGLPPIKARAKLRKEGMKKDGTRWNFSGSEVKRIRKILADD